MLVPLCPEFCIVDALIANVGERKAMLMILIPNVIPAKGAQCKTIVYNGGLHFEIDIALELDQFLFVQASRWIFLIFSSNSLGKTLRTLA